MVKTTRDFEIEATDTRILSLEADVVATKRDMKVATALSNLEKTPDYQLAIQGYMIDDESKRLCDHLTGSEVLSELDVKAINEALSMIRGLKSIIANTKRLGENAEDTLVELVTKLKEERTYREIVSMCKEDLSDLTDRLGE